MKKLYYLLLLSASVLLFSCKSGKESGNEVMYEYEESASDLNPELKKKIGDWAREGVVCYGCVVAVDGNRIPLSGKVVKAKIVTIKPDSLKMKALESVTVGEGEKEGCTKLGIAKGETWWETDGELFLEKEAAETFLRDKGLLK